MHVGEGQKLVPIERRNRMLALSDVKGDGVHDGLIERWHLIRTQVLPAEQAIHLSRCHAGEELASRIAPPVVFRACDVYRAWGDQGDQFVGIDRKLINPVGVF